MDREFQGKVALVTGASRGIGRGIALDLAEAGCDLLLSGRDEAALQSVAREIEALGRRAVVHVADLTAPDEPRGLSETLARAYDRLDILVNNAGAARRRAFLELTDADWREGFDLKFFAHVRLCQLVWGKLKESRGSVVAISGIGARAPVSDYLVGATVIGASLAFMKGLADLGKADGIRVNTINPGSVETDRLKHRIAIIKARTGLDEAGARARHLADIGVSRFGTPEDIAHLVRFIVSEKGSWLQGTTIDIDGGQTVPLRMSKYD
jgi:3-oxoacyl-[acyl-carrier protein] reductase